MTCVPLLNDNVFGKVFKKKLSKFVSGYLESFNPKHTTASFDKHHLPPESQLCHLDINRNLVWHDCDLGGMNCNYDDTNHQIIK